MIYLNNLLGLDAPEHGIIYSIMKIIKWNNPKLDPFHLN